MASRNVTTVMDAYKAFNRRDLEKDLGFFAENGVYYDIARNVSFRGMGEIGKFIKDWWSAMSNAEVYEPTFIDAGDTVVAQYTMRGKNDGPLCTWAATGKDVAIPYCEVIAFDKDGKILTVRSYGDRLTLLEQLGHATKG